MTADGVTSFVEVGPGKGSGNTAQLVASKATQFGFADGYVVGNAVSKGMNIRAVAGLYRRNPTAVVVLADSDIKTPKDLEGARVGVRLYTATTPSWLRGILADDYGVDVTPRLKTLKVSEPPVRQAGIKVADVDALVAKLKELGVA